MASNPQIFRMEIPEVWALTPRDFLDARGSFTEIYNARAFAAIGIDLAFVQDNQSTSARRGTLRGLHFQIPPMAQPKLVRVVKGSALDVAVDIRRGSPTYGRHVSRELSASNREQFFVPAGFAHGFCTLEDETVVIYKVSEFYSPEHERGLRWDDPSLGIDWGVATASVLLSLRDEQYPAFDELPPFFEYRLDIEKSPSSMNSMGSESELSAAREGLRSEGGLKA